MPTAAWWHGGRRIAADAALRTAATPAGADILVHASALDAELDAWRVLMPPEHLPSRIAASAPTTAKRRGLRWWWPGIGIAATLAGAAAGTAAVAMVAPVEVGSGTTSFGDLGGSDG